MNRMKNNAKLDSEFSVAKVRGILNQQMAFVTIAMITHVLGAAPKGSNCSLPNNRELLLIYNVKSSPIVVSCGRILAFGQYLV